MSSLYFQICAQGFFFWLSYDLSRFPVIPLYAQKLGLPPEMIGVAVAASTLTGVFGKFLAGGLSDSFGRRLMMIVACLIAVLLPPLYFLADSAESLITLRLFHGLGTAIMGPVGRAFVADIVPAERRGNLLSTYTASTNLGTMAGRSLGGFLLFWGGFFYPFAASGLAAAIGLGLAFRWPRDQQYPFQWIPLLKRMKHGFREVGQQRVIWMTSLVEAVQYLTMGAVDAFLPLYAKGEAHLNDWQVGMLYGIQMFTTILMKPLMGWVSDRFGRRPQILVGLLMGGVVVWRIPWETSFTALTILVVLFGLSVSLTTSATSALVTDVCRREHYGSAHGVFGTIMDMGHAAGPISAGLLIGWLGFRSGFMIDSVLLILASLFFAILVKDERG